MRESISRAIEKLLWTINDEFRIDPARRASLDDLDEKIVELESVHSKISNAVLATLASLTTQTKRSRNNHASINKLPSELLSHCLLDVTTYFDRDAASNRSLAQVCRLWYDTVVSTSLFWPVVDICKKDTADMVLKHNKNVPLTVWCRTDDGNYDADDAERFLANVSGDSERWEYLTYVGPYTEALASHMEKPTTMLKGLYAEIRENEAVTKRINLSDGGPMQHLDIDRISLPWDLQRLRAFEGLRIMRLDTDLPTIRQMHTILAASPNIEHVALNQWRQLAATDARVDSSGELGSMGQIVLPQCLSIELDRVGDDLATYFFQHISAPKCQSLFVNQVLAHQLTFDEPSSPLQLLTASVSAASEVVLTYGDGGKTFHLASTPDLVMDKSWIDKKKDPPGFDVLFDLSRCPPQWWEALGTFLSAQLAAKTVTLKFAGKVFLVYDDAGTAIPAPAMPVDAIANHFPFLTKLSFGPYYEASPLLNILAHPRPNATGEPAWPCPSLTYLNFSDYNHITVVAGPLLNFAERRMRAATARREPSDPEPPKKLETLYLKDDIIEMFRGTAFLDGVECIT